MNDIQDNAELKEIKIGKFKPKRPFLNFVGAVSGARIRMISNSAFIKGEKLSGILDGTKFKFTLKDNGTLDIEEIETSKSDDAMIKRLLDDIDETDVTGYAGKFIVHGLEFESEKGERLYLEVEHQKPIDKLKSLFDDTDETQISEKASGFLDQLFSASDDAKDYTEVADVDEKNELISDTKSDNTENTSVSEKEPLSYMEESFKKMNEQKVNELQYRIEEAEKNILKFKRDIQQSERSINSESERLSVLQARLDSFNVNEEPTGYVFQVSDAKQSERELSDVEKSIVIDIAKIIKADENMLTKLLSNAMYVIKLAKKDNFEDKSITKEVLEKIKQIDLNGSVILNTDGDFEYRGKLTWHQIVDKLIKKGFEQDPEFEKLAGSNSYIVEKPDLNTENITEEKTDTDMKHIKNFNESLKNNEFTQKHYKTYTEPTDLVILGTIDANDNRDIEIDDDYASLEIRVNEKPVKSIETDGFVSILTVDQYKKWHKKWMDEGALTGDDEDDRDIGLEAIFVAGFTGTIGIGVFSKKMGYVTDFDATDFICHDDQFNNDYPEVFINFDGDADIHDITSHNLKNVVPYMRDKTIVEILK